MAPSKRTITRGKFILAQSLLIDNNEGGNDGDDEAAILVSIPFIGFKNIKNDDDPKFLS